MVVGPEDVKWTAMTLLKTFTAYCGQDRRETEWVIEGKGSRSVPGMWAQCAVGRFRQTYAGLVQPLRTCHHARLGGDKCACLGCGRVDAQTDFSKQMRAPCSRCGRQTEWACGQKEVVCRGCGHALSVSTVRGLSGEEADYKMNRSWQIGGGVAGFCSTCGSMTPWLSWHVTYANTKSYHDYAWWPQFTTQLVRRCLWCGDER